MAFITIFDDKPRKCQACDRFEQFHARCFIPGCTACFHNIDEIKGHFSRENDDAQHKALDPCKEITFEDVAKILSCTIKQDRENKLIIFANCLNSQTENDQFTITNTGGSSEGKTWTTLEVCDYFPDKEKIIISNASPTAFYHEYGILVKESIDEEGRTRYEPIEDELQALEREIEELRLKKQKIESDKVELERLKNHKYELRKSAKRLINLESKIVVFLDQANPRLMENLRSLISHDRKFIELSITNRTGRGVNYTEHIVLAGYPSMIFCTAYQKMNEQEITRTFQISPETSQEKLNETVKLIIKKKANERTWYRELSKDLNRQSLIFRIELIRALGIKQFNSETFSETILQRFLKTRPHLQPRHQRDLPRIYNLIHAHALLNCFSRNADGGDVVEISEKDVQAGFDIYEPIAEANEHNVSPEIWELYKNIVEPAYKMKPPVENKKLGVSRSEIKAAFLAKYHRPLSSWTLSEQIIPSLLDAGLVSDSKNPDDARERLYTPVGSVVYTPDSVLFPAQRSNGNKQNNTESTVYTTTACQKCGSEQAVNPIVRPGLLDAVFLCDSCATSWDGKL